MFCRISFKVVGGRRERFFSLRDKTQPRATLNLGTYALFNCTSDKISSRRRWPGSSQLFDQQLHRTHDLAIHLFPQSSSFVKSQIKHIHLAEVETKPVTFSSRNGTYWLKCSRRFLPRLEVCFGGSSRLQPLAKWQPSTWRGVNTVKVQRYLGSLILSRTVLCNQVIWSALLLKEGAWKIKPQFLQGRFWTPGNFLKKFLYPDMLLWLDESPDYFSSLSD